MLQTSGSDYISGENSKFSSLSLQLAIKAIKNIILYLLIDIFIFINKDFCHFGTRMKWASYKIFKALLP